MPSEEETPFVVTHADIEQVRRKLLGAGLAGGRSDVAGMLAFTVEMMIAMEMSRELARDIFEKCYDATKKKLVGADLTDAKKRATSAKMYEAIKQLVRPVVGQPFAFTRADNGEQVVVLDQPEGSPLILAMQLWLSDFIQEDGTVVWPDAEVMH